MDGERKIPRLSKAGWTRHQEKYREASFKGADGAVGNVAKHPYRFPRSAPHFRTYQPPRLRLLLRLRDIFLMAQPPRLGKAGNTASFHNLSFHQPLSTPLSRTPLHSPSIASKTSRTYAEIWKQPSNRVLVAERDADLACRLDDVVIDRHGFSAANCFADRNRFHIWRQQRHHAAEGAFADQARSSGAESSAENAIESSRRAAALKVTQNDHAGLFTRQLANSGRHLLTHSPETLLAAGVFGFGMNEVAAARESAFGDRKSVV